MAENTPESAADVIALAGDITIAWQQNPNVHPGAQDVPDFLKSMYAAIAGLGIAAPASTDAGAHEPAVSVRSSVKPDYLVSLIDGKKYQTLKRHLAGHGLTPETYRERYGLKSDYPMVAANFAAKRRDIAARIGLGRKAAASAQTSSEAVIGAPVEEVKDTSGKTASGRSKATAKTPAPAKRPARQPKHEGSVAVIAPVDALPDTASETLPEAATDTPATLTTTRAKASAKPKRTGRQPAATASSPEVAALPVADPVAEVAPPRAKPRRTARIPDVSAKADADTPVDTAIDAAPVAGSAGKKPKAKRADAAKTAATKSKTAAKAKPADAPARKPRAKKSLAQAIELALPEG